MCLKNTSIICTRITTTITQRKRFYDTQEGTVMLMVTYVFNYIFMYVTNRLYNKETTKKNIESLFSLRE